MELVVRSNVSCSVVGRKRARGREGVNRVPFDGRVHGRPLDPGRYTISVNVIRHGARTRVGTVGVAIVQRGRIPATAGAGCASSPGGSSTGTAAASLARKGASARPRASKDVRQPGASFTPPRIDIGGRPGGGGDAGRSVFAWISLIVYALFGLATVMLVVNTTRFLRGWNP